MKKSTHKSRFAIGAAVCTAAMVATVPIGDASAGGDGRGDGWQPLAFAPYDAACGTTTVHVSTSVNKEYYRETILPDGTVQWQVTGALTVKYATGTGESVIVNASGPGHLLVFPSTDVQVLAKGLNSYTFTQEQAETLGVPQISVSAGPIDVTWHPDGTVSGHMGNIIRDVCAELT
jgi:hypothetical protein